MPVYDELPRGLQDSVSHHVRGLKRSADFFKDAVATLRTMAPPLLIGLEDDIRSIDKLVEDINDRWGYYLSRQEWASTEDVQNHLNSLPQATGKKNGNTEVIPSK